jgi:hypothetical protein
LHKQLKKEISADAATEAAMEYANKRCKGGQLSEGGGDYV